MSTLPFLVDREFWYNLSGKNTNVVRSFKISKNFNYFQESVLKE